MDFFEADFYYQTKNKKKFLAKQKEVCSVSPILPLPAGMLLPKKKLLFFWVGTLGFILPNKKRFVCNFLKIFFYFLFGNKNLLQKNPFWEFAIFLEYLLLHNSHRLDKVFLFEK